MSDLLAATLWRYPPALHPTAEPEPLGNAGGWSGARLWRYTSRAGLLVARAWPTDGPDEAELETIHGWLARAGGLPFVPVPRPGLDGRTVQVCGGRLWEVAPWMPGRADPSALPDRGRLRAGFAGLAEFHRFLAPGSTRGPSPGLARRLGQLDDLLRGGFSFLGRALDRAPVDPSRDLARRWLDLAQALAPRVRAALPAAALRAVRLQPCLRDARPDHFLFEGDRLTGLVDFGAMGVDAVSADLARLLAEWIGSDLAARAEALAAYETVRPLDSDESALIAPFESSAALLGGGLWVRWHFLEGRRFADPEAVLLGLRRGLERLERWAQENDD